MTFRFDDANKEQKLDRIRAVIEEHVAPQLAFDGGGVQVLDLMENTVVIAYSGACACCPMALSGTLSMIQETLAEHIDSRLVVKPTFFPTGGCC
jgi:Fe-S cluster biogenesis protein NfuA